MLTPITKHEFAGLLRRCMIPGGWPRIIAVANSGGPDSICLLYFLCQIFPSSQGRIAQPSAGPIAFSGTPQILSLNIDHGLQASSADMSARCASFAAKLGVDHVCRKIPWGEAGFPPQPTESFERDARSARYDVFFDTMLRTGSNTLALAHHLDDQVETSLMRLGKGSSLLGASGMRPIRRWGMSEAPSKGSEQRDLEGMNMWMIRPLLQVGKDRILATCEVNGLEYVTDRTNFQPNITIRNAIRHVIKNDGKTNGISEPYLKERLREIDVALSKHYEGDVSISSGLDRLRLAVSDTCSTVDAIEAKVDKFLSVCRLPSPPGTILLSRTTLESFGSDPVARKAFVERILRYVSPEPWGSLRAQASRRSSQIDRIIGLLWRPIPSTTTAFTAGSGVMWKPVAFREGEIKEMTLQAQGTICWIAYRQPPAKKNEGLRESRTLQERDLTSLVNAAYLLWTTKQGPEAIEVLWDRRFRIEFKLSKIPPRIVNSLTFPKTRLVVDHRGKWFLPRITLQTNDNTEATETLVIHQDSGQTTSSQIGKAKTSVYADWIKTTFIRELSAV